MKTVEQLLKKNSAKPQRELKNTFTQTITTYLNEHPRKTRFEYIKEMLSMKYMPKPAIAFLAVVGTIVAGGTAYATTGGWPAIQAFFGGQQKVDNARIVTVSTENCTITGAFSITAKDKTQNAYYYKIKDDSKLTNEQVVQMVRGFCELQPSVQTSLDIQGELQKNPLNKDTIVGGYIDSKVLAMSDSSITIESAIPTGETIQTVTQTFPRIDPRVIVYEGAKRLSLTDIKVGDHVSISYRASGDALAHSETISPGNVDTQGQIVVAIARNSKDFTASIDYQKYNGKEFEQVVPCSEQASGYCNAEQYLGR